MACPLCGGPIHPIAGRCKHCRADLSAMRSGAAAHGPAALPALAPVAAPIAPAASAPHAITAYAQHAGSNGHALPPLGAGALPPAAVVVAPAASAVPAVSAWSRRWPIVVVVLAGIAIVVSIALLLQGDDEPRSSRQKRVPLPSMDNNMNTDPMIPQQGQQTTPPPPGWGGPPPLDPNDPAPVPAPAPTPPATGQVAPSREHFPREMLATACAQLRTCGGDDIGLVEGLCSPAALDMVDHAPGCENSYDAAMATECLHRIESMVSCGSSANGLDPDKLLLILGGLPECSEACN